MQRLVIASHNAHKVEEFRHLLSPLNVAVIGLPEGMGESPEAASTFEANAMEKAVYYGMRCQSLVLADDSGLCVDALDGRPGVHSARYAGVHGDDAANNARLLKEMEHIPDEKRTAQFVCALSLWNPSLGSGIVVRGMVHGLIARAPRGTNGFGYDPLFYLPSLLRSYAELDMAEKSELSHRSQAIDALMACMGGQADAIVFGR
jgi:XTP/dITP diphosphohydrolase